METTVLSDASGTTRAYMFLMVGVTAASLAAVFILYAQDAGIPSLVIAAGRLIIATLILLPSVFRNRDYKDQIRALSRSDVVLVGFAGFFLAVHFGAWVSSLEYTSVLISVVIVSTSPIWVAMLEVVFLRTKLSRIIIFGLLIVLLGGLIIGLAGSGSSDGTNTGTQDQVLGGTLSAIGAIAIAAYLVIGRKVRGKLSLTPYISMVYGSAALVLLMTVLLTGTHVTGPEPQDYLWILLLALFPQLIGHTSFNYALAYLPATLISIAGQMEPIFGAIFAFFLFDQVPVVGQLIGGAIIMVGVLMTILGQARN